MSIDAIIVSLLVLGALGFLGYRYYKQLKNPKACGSNCGCGDKLNQVKKSRL